MDGFPERQLSQRTFVSLLVPALVKEPTMPRMTAPLSRPVPSPRTGSRTAAKSSARSTAKGEPKLRLSTSLDQVPLPELWVRYRKSSDIAIRNYFWEKYIHLVRYIAERTWSRLPDEVDLHDLISAGQFGLMDAIDAFDPDRGVKFETYCANRIKGAILDELRAMDWVPRLVRSRTNKVEGVANRFIMANGRAPTKSELSSELGVNGEEWEKIDKDSKAVGTVSLSRKCFTSDGNKDVLEIDVINDESQVNPLQESQRRDIKELITRGLSRAERLIVVLYYYEEMTMKEIGATLDLSESRVSQMHSSILARLKAQMQHKAKDIDPAVDD